MVHDMKRTKSVRLLLSVCLILLFALSAVLPASAAKTVIRETVSLLNVRANAVGDGYEWKNRTDDLILTNLNIDTDDPYGLKICAGATVTLIGDNYIRASKAAIYLGGTVTFKGDGTLTLVSDSCGILSLSEDVKNRIRIIGGTIRIQAGETGIRSLFSEVVLSGGKTTIEMTDEAGTAIDAYHLAVSSGATLKANAPLHASYKLTLSDATIDIAASRTALSCDNAEHFSVENLKIQTGADAASLQSAEAYAGENAFSAVTTVVRRIPSILFGEKYTIALDITLLIVFILLLLAVIIVPKLIKRQKLKKLLAERDAKKAAQN